MALKPQHSQTKVERVQLRAVDHTPHEALSELRRLMNPDPSERAVGTATTRQRSAYATEAFALRYMKLRDQLAWRAAKGEALSAVDRATLHALNALLDELEPPSSPLPDDVSGLLRDILAK